MTGATSGIFDNLEEYMSTTEIVRGVMYVIVLSLRDVLVSILYPMSI